jgi:nucleotide-binding universal stress UspA family protein
MAIKSEDDKKEGKVITHTLMERK